MSKTQSTVYLDEEQRERLRELSKKNWIPMAAMIRKGVDLAIDYFEELEEMKRDGDA